MIKEDQIRQIKREYIGESDLSQYNYLKIDWSSKSPPQGLIDTRGQWLEYIRLADLLGLTIVQSTAPLQPKHNNGRPASFLPSDYFDINSFHFQETPRRKAIILKNCDSIRPEELLTLKALNYSGDFSMRNLRLILKESNVSRLEYSANHKYKALADDFLCKNKIEACVHIRRGDRLKLGVPPMGISPEEMDYGTRSKNIIDFLDYTEAPNSIYIMTDMKAEDQVVKELRNAKKYNFSFLYDYSELVSLKSKNNYDVFHLEWCIKNHEAIKFRSERFEPVIFYKNKHDLPQT